MQRIKSTRRTTLAVAAAVGLLLTACGVGGGPTSPAPADPGAPDAASTSAEGTSGPTAGGAGTGSLRATWWGGDSENTALQAVFKAYAETTGMTIQTEPLAWDGYWDKLATVTASGGSPDLLMQAGSRVPEYANNGALADLGALPTLDTSNIDEGLLEFGQVDGKVYGVVAAANAMSIVANEDVLAAAGVTLPDGPYTFEDLADTARAVHAALPEVYGIHDFGGDLINFILWVRMDGTQFYADDGSLNATEDDVREWLQYWEDLRQEGVAPPADVTAETGGQGNMPISPIAIGDAAFASGWTQDYVAYTEATEADLSINLSPYSAEHPTLWMNAASLWSISESSENKEAAVELINYMISDADAVKTLGLSLGLPPSQFARGELSDEMSPAQKAASDYMDLVGETNTPLNRLWPDSFTPLRTKMGDVNEAVAFGQMSIDDAVTEFFAEYEANK